jgi:hypothetical protein
VLIFSVDAAHKRIGELEQSNAELQDQLRHQSLTDGCVIMDSEYQVLKDSVDNMTLELEEKNEQVEAFMVCALNSR